jgi:hypothetical protein
MKKRTVITTETREVWVISGGGATPEKVVHPQPGNVSKVEGRETLVSTDSGDQNALSIPEKDTP